MKDGVVIVNTARGAIMNEDALVQALDSGKVLSAGLDVFEEEPTIHPGLLRNPNVMLLPHMGTWTVEVISNFICVSFFLPLRSFILFSTINYWLDTFLPENCVQTQTAMEEWTIENIRLALETGKLKSPVLEQAGLLWREWPGM
jgi:glyoxylate reductase